VITTLLAALVALLVPLGAQSAGHPPEGAGQTQAVTKQTVVSFTFDDGDADQLTAARVLQAYRMPGTFYIITGAVGTPGYLSRADLRGLAAAGDEIGGHTVSHLSLPQISLAEVRRQVCDGREILSSWGYQVRSFAYPDATYDPAVEAIVRDCGFASGRIGDGIRNGECPGCAAAETIPPRNPYAVRTPGQIDTSWTLRDMQQAVIAAERGGGGWVPFVFHHVCNDPAAADCGNLSITPAQFSQFVAWVAQRARSGTVVKTVGDVVGGPLRPVILAPRAPAHGVMNPSLASVSNSAAVSTATESTNGLSVPTCWMEGGYGSNTVTWQRPRDTRTGQWAEQVTMASHVSGDAKLLQRFDLGECALPVKQGRVYALSAWYKSTVRVQFSVYYRNASGTWVYWTSGPYLPAAAQWTQATWDTLPIPPGASGLSFGLAISSVGSLTTDGYSIHAVSATGGRVLLGVMVLVVGSAALRRLWARRLPAGRQRRGQAARAESKTARLSRDSATSSRRIL
jgi:peptidoglycan/xylan/chitin deacetylase (PgdA/CDA1 family)